MHPVLAHDIVPGARIWKIVHLHIVLDAFPDEAQAVFPDDDIVHSPLADEQLALQVAGLCNQAWSIYLSPYITSYHFQSMTGPPATATLNISG